MTFIDERVGINYDSLKPMIFWRKIIFYIFLLIYITITPWLILRMLGFVWHPASFHLIKTGLAVIHSNPPDAEVFIDGKRSSRLTPVIVHELLPGDHFIRLKKEGFEDWLSRFTITSNKVTLLDTINLSPSP